MALQGVVIGSLGTTAGCGVIARLLRALSGGFVAGFVVGCIGLFASLVSRELLSFVGRGLLQFGLAKAEPSFPRAALDFGEIPRGRELRLGVRGWRVRGSRLS